ncbi:MAG: hypothetical protein NZP34_00350 [Caldilineales bacterium]|nr:hypothetical protein [Caldilineales bacterium]
MAGFASNPVIFNVTLTNANTEYSLTLPQGCTHFEFQARQSVAVEFAFVSGGPYMTLKAGGAYSSYNLWGGQSLTIFFRSTTAGTIVELVAWR